MADVTVTITIPTALVARVSAATNCTTKAQFQDWVRAKIKEHVISYEGQQASIAAKAAVKAAEDSGIVAVNTAIANAETDIILT